MAKAWALGAFLSMWFLLGSACKPQPPPADCLSLAKLRAQFSGAVLGPDECGSFGTKDRYGSIEGVSFDNVEEGKQYTLVMVDPDAPGSGAEEGWLHWILSGVKGSDVKSGALTGEILMKYAPPTPPNGTGNHRYFIYLYEEAPGSTFSQVDVRRKFNLKNYAEKNGLCGPIAMNMFETSY